MRERERCEAYLPLDTLEFLLPIELLIELTHAGRRRPCRRERPVDVLLAFVALGFVGTLCAGEVSQLLFVVFGDAGFTSVSCIL